MLKRILLAIRGPDASRGVIAMRFAGAAAMNDERDALGVHSTHHAHQPRPSYGSEGDFAGLTHEKHGLLAVEDGVDFEIEVPRQQRPAATRGRSGKDEGGAANQR